MALLQTKSGSGGGYVNSFSFSFTSDITSGSLLVLNLIAGNADTISSITDNRSNTWTLAVNSSNPTVGERQSWLYYVKNAASGATTVTVTYSGGMFPDSSYIAREYSGMDTAAPLDKTSSANDGSSFVQTHSAGTTAATTQADELVVLGGGSSGSASPTFAAGTGYGNGVEQKGFDSFTYGFLSDKTVVATGTQTGNFTSTSFVRGQGFIGTFKAATTTVTTKKLTLLGVG